MSFNEDATVQGHLYGVLSDDFSHGKPVDIESKDARISGRDKGGIIVSLMRMSESNNVLVVATDDSSRHIASCFLPKHAFSEDASRACLKFAELSRFLDKVENESRGTVSVIRYNPTDEFSGVYYSTRTRIKGEWRVPLRFKARRHLVDAIAATKMWRALPLAKYKKELV